MTILANLKAYIKACTPIMLWSMLHRTRHFIRGKLSKSIVFLTYPLSPILGRLAFLKFKALRGKQISTYFANSQVKKLQLGAGSNSLPGWLNSEAFIPSSF